MSNSVDVCYLTLPTDSADQAFSLAGYLSNHGVNAVREGDEVTCPLKEPTQAEIIHRLRGNWQLFWQHNDRELFTATPVYRKEDCGVGGQGCPYCGAGPVIG